MTTRGNRSDTRRDAMNAARKLLEPRLDLVGDLADAGAAIDVAEEALRTAEQALLQARRDYLDRHRAAVRGGWSEDQLSAAGCPADRGRARSGRRRTPPAPTATEHVAASTKTNEEPAGQLHPSSGDVPSPRPEPAPGEAAHPDELATIGAHSSP
jgi:hypothetical protein